MTGYGFLRSIRFLFGVGFLALLVLLVYVGLIFGFCHEIFREISFKHQYGAEWEVQYEQTYGPLSKAHTTLGVAAFGIIGLTASGLLLARGLKNGSRSQRKKQRRDESRIGRHVQYTSVMPFWEFTSACREFF